MVDFLAARAAYIKGYRNATDEDYKQLAANYQAAFLLKEEQRDQANRQAEVHRLGSASGE